MFQILGGSINGYVRYEGGGQYLHFRSCFESWDANVNTQGRDRTGQ